MRELLNHQKRHQNLVTQDELVSEIHDNLLDDNNLDIQHAFNQACCEIAGLYIEIEKLERGISAGFVRKK